MSKQFVKAMSTACEVCELPFAYSFCEGTFYWDYNIHLACLWVTYLSQSNADNVWSGYSL